MKLMFESVIRKNWWVGTLAALAFLFAGNTRAAIWVGIGAIVWNVVLYGVTLYVERQRKNQ